MAIIVMLIRGALANALAFTGSSYLFHRLSADNINAERKRHDAAIEALQKAQVNLCKFDLEDMGKLVTIIATSEMTSEYLIKQKILQDGPSM